LGGTPIGGATASDLLLTNVQPSQAGTYTVTVTNAAGSASASATLTVTADSLIPVVKFLSPGYGKAAINPVVSLTGQAIDKGGLVGSGIISSVKYSLNGGATNDAVVSAGTGAGVWNWSTGPVTLNPGTNTLYVIASDLAGNTAAIGTASPKNVFFYDTTNNLTVNLTGVGTVHGGGAGFTKAEFPNGLTNGTLIPVKVGRPYILLASVGKGTNWVFTNWSGGVSVAATNFSVANKLTLTMTSNMVVSANFITNPFTPVAGAYNGLFSEGDGIRHQSAGFVFFKLSDKAGYSGKLYVDGDAHSISGKFDAKGETTKVVSRLKLGKGPVTLSLKLDWYTGSDMVHGTVSDGTYTSEIDGDRAIFSETTNPETTYNGRYTMVIPRTNYPGSGPGGLGYGLITNSTGGIISLVGNLGDGEKIVQKVSISKQGLWPMFAPLYKSTTTDATALPTGIRKETIGMLMGWVNFTNQTPEGAVNWVKKVVASSNLVLAVSSNYYPGGFSNTVDLVSSPYVEPTLAQEPIGFSSGYVLFEEGNLSGPLSNTVSVTAAKVLTQPSTSTSTNKIVVALAKKTGLATFTFLHPETFGRKSVGFGAVLQNQTNAQGYFQGTNNAGTGNNHYGSALLRGF
jgi:hypothetical protein